MPYFLLKLKLIFDTLTPKCKKYLGLCPDESTDTNGLVNQNVKVDNQEQKPLAFGIATSVKQVQKYSSNLLVGEWVYIQHTLYN